MADLNLKKDDTAPAFTCVCEYNDGTIQDVTGAAATFAMWLAGSRGTPKVNDSAMVMVGPGTNGTFAYNWVANDVDTAGVYHAEVHVTLADGKKVTFPNSGYDVVTIEPRV